MNILQICSGRDVNGALVYAQSLSNRLVESGHRVIMMARPQSWMLTQTNRFETVSCRMRRFPHADLNFVRQLIQREQIDLVHTHMTRAHNFGVCLKMLYGTPLVATAHARQIQLHWRFNDLVLANSRATADFLERYRLVPKRRVKTIHCFVELEKFESVGRPERNRQRRELHLTDEPLIGIVGEVIPRKGHHVLFEAVAQLAEEFPRLKVAIIGRFRREEPYVQKLRSYQIKNKLFQRIKWLGRRPNVNAYLPAFDVTVVPSLEEPLGLVAIESQAAGVPVIASATGGLTEIINHRETGVLFEKGNASELAKAIRTVLTNGPLSRRIAEQGKLSARANFAPEHLTQSVERSLEQLLATKRRAA